MKYFFLLIFSLPTIIFSQKKVIDHTVYNDWKKIGDTKISADGKHTVYTIKPHRGDGYLYIINNQTGAKDSIFRAVSPVFSGDQKYVAFKITPGFDTLRNCELKDIKKEKWPKDSLGIYFFESKKVTKIEKIKSFNVSAETSWMSYLVDGNKLPVVKKKKRLFRKEVEEKKYESEGNVFVIYEPNENLKFKKKDVKQVYFPSKGNSYVFVTHKKDKLDTLQIFAGSAINNESLWQIPAKFNAVSAIQFNQRGNEITFTASLDTAKNKVYQLYHADLENKKLNLLIDTVNSNFSKLFAVSKNYQPNFSYNGKRIFFGIADKPKKELKDSLLESEKVKLDIWHWQDDRLQPQQLSELENDQKSTFLAVYDLSDNSIKILESDTLEINKLDHGNSDFAVGYVKKPYQKNYNWEYPNKRDAYLINVKTGESKLIKKAIIYGIDLSTDGKSVIWFNDRDLQQYHIDLRSGKESCITCGQKSDWLEDVNGMAQTPSPLGVIGWLKGEKEVLIQSKYDIWSYNIDSKLLTSMTSQFGEKNKIRLRINSWESDSTFIQFDNTYVIGFHEKDKSSTIYKPKYLAEKLILEEAFQSNHDFLGFKKAKKSSEYIFQKSSLQDYPDLFCSDWVSNSVAQKISNTNPQQREYNWATVELINWKSYEGIPLEGLLYKPENYDSTQKYPLLVYFYEMYSDELHNHYAPKPTASIIYPTEYCSAGYFVLIPDIRYKIGHPAKGAYDCIMSGTDYVLNKFKAIDSTRMGLQGQSWGGYQTAQLITMTNRFKVAMAGAPVGNMFSAYGGIRWGSGLNRQFQYEKTQSRIGKTIWEAPELYIENSPLFHLPKVQTPLLIMHNDADGSVPWYQGIELFTGLKRLDKPVWMLNYNGDDHNLMKNANRMDLSWRMRQFFDFYLLNQPAPQWLIEGIPAIDKGREFGFGETEK
jgi:dipeptidyl aminopeptidase/acylaminoacyl peptidase